MPVRAIYCAWPIASVASSSLHPKAATPKRSRASLWVLRTVWRSKASPRLAGAGQLGLGSVAALAEVAISKARTNARFIGGDFARRLVNNGAICLGKDQRNIVPMTLPAGR